MYQIRDDAPLPMTWEEYQGIVYAEWFPLLNAKNVKEKEIQEFLERHPCMIPQAFPSNGATPFPSAVISQPVLPGLRSPKPDFMWIASDSGTIYPVLIEIEKPSKKWFTKKNLPSSELVQAQDQLTEWQTWFGNPENILQFMRYYRIPDSLREGRNLKPLYVLIYGRRKESKSTLIRAEKRGHLPKRENEYWMTFDRLKPNYGCREFMCVKVDYEGYRALTVPPTLHLVRNGAPLHLFYRGEIRDKQTAVKNNPYILEKRKEFLIERFSYWDEIAKAKEAIERQGNDTRWE